MPSFSVDDFKNNFRGAEPPDALVKLGEIFANRRYLASEGLELREHGDGRVAGFFEDEGALARLFAFGQANNSGSEYALWQQHDGQSTSDMPVILFGDEGGMCVIAENARALLQLFSVYCEPHIETDYEADRETFPHGREFVRFYDDRVPEDEDELERFIAFRGWLKSELGFEPLTAEQATARAADASSKLQAAFDAWAKPLLPS